MNIVILHCHFERGGVTQVVENHVRALRDDGGVAQIALVAGDRVGGLSPETLAATTLVQIDDFDYDRHDQAADELPDRAKRIADRLSRQLSALGIGSDNSVLHWHNHGLGKNTAAPRVIRRLAQEGWRILAQIHDFAEDNRPENYRRLIAATGAVNKAELDGYLYPVAPQIHYATLTQADAAILAQLGVPEPQTHCLPNGVVPPGGEPDRDDSLEKVRRAMQLPGDATWSLYPVRGIRRKNVGEFLALSRWLGPQQYAGLTLCPATEVERHSYLRWKALAADVAPQAVFDAGHYREVSFGENLAAADFILSTSVAEGFGMAFLEPWLADREVVARRLPTVIDDFERCGVRFPKLYDAVPIPGDRQWLAQCRQATAAAAESAWSTVAREFHPAPSHATLGSDTGDDADSIDFACLTPRLQVEVLQKLAADSGFESSVKALSRPLVDALSAPPGAELIAANAELVAERYSPQRTRDQLTGIYRHLSSAPAEAEVGSPARAGIAVDLISAARPIYPCRTEAFDG